MTRFLIDNSGRSGVAANMKISEFKASVYYPGAGEDLARYRILVSEHKTADKYACETVVWGYDDLHKPIDMYPRTVRNQSTTTAPQVEQLFVSGIGMSPTSS